MMAKPTPQITADWLLSRVYVDEETPDCLIWKGYSQNNNPKATFGSDAIPYPVRRVVWVNKMGHEPRENYDVVARCGTPLCVNPDCLVERHRSKRNKGRKQPPAEVIKRTMGQRAKSKINTPEALELLRTGPGTQDEIAARLGVSQSLVSKIRLGKNWRDYTSPFAGLGAR